MSKVRTMAEAIREFVPDGSAVATGQGTPPPTREELAALAGFDQV